MHNGCTDRHRRPITPMPQLTATRKALCNADIRGVLRKFFNFFLLSSLLTCSRQKLNLSMDSFVICGWWCLSRFVLHCPNARSNDHFHHLPRHATIARRL